ncbi:uncharacterized protein MELLADRAFT_112032 [Melampsora larici-populina 98AG31]|uniref:Uncharacterized protein n=1 Tax=Melampsora larici-populina (strain 98AG31 / pathotype 3-4-7) TaxID=747676 RepID=F4S562_MELLP|nr:uncharacterized protein MELLADRAFT_112032 [Melampsora larici-populina 98AG31]EGG00113.1 hypothetical protein MELLADRAFT_112032 [Melampsora larici-populina 98AG31]
MDTFSKLSSEDQATDHHVSKVHSDLEQVGVQADGFVEGIKHTIEYRPCRQHFSDHQSQRKQNLCVAENRVESRRILKFNEISVAVSSDSISNTILYKLDGQWSNQSNQFGRFCYEAVRDRWKRADDQLIERYTTQITNDQDPQIDLDVQNEIYGHILLNHVMVVIKNSLLQFIHTFGMYCGTCGYCRHYIIAMILIISLHLAILL